MKPSLQTILAKDADDLKSGGYENIVLAAGDVTAKIINFTEEDTFQYIALEIQEGKDIEGNDLAGKRVNIFYNYYIYGTEDINGDLIKWLKALATNKITDKTTMLDITNSSIGSTYKFKVYNYTSKSGKNAGKQNHQLDFKTLPTKQVVKVEAGTEDLDLDDLPF